MAGRGGARSGSGQKKGSHRVHVKELRDAIEAKMGQPYQEILADTYLKLHNHFQNNEFIKEFLIFQENMSKRLLEQETEVTENSMADLTSDEINEKLNTLLKQNAPVTPVLKDPNKDAGS